MSTPMSSTPTYSTANVVKGSKDTEKRTQPISSTDSSDSSSEIEALPDLEGGGARRMLKRCKKYDYLENDYREPTLRKLPPVPHGVWRHPKDICAGKKGISEKELASKEIIWKHLHEMNLLKAMKYRTYADFRNRQREIVFNIPTLDYRDLRRGKTPPTIHIPLELEEDKLYFASRFLRGLVHLQEEMVREIPHYKLRLKPLAQMPNTVRFLGDVARKINLYIHRDEQDKVFSLAFYTARHFEKREGCCWLADQFYKVAQHYSKGYQKDFGYSEALINYMYGRYQLLKDRNPRSAIASFCRAVKASSGTLWEAGWTTCVISERLSIYTAYLHHIALLMEAERVARLRPSQAAGYAEKATDILKQGNWHPDLEEALMDLAIYKTQSKKYDEAILILENLEKTLQNEIVDERSYRDMFMCVQVLLALCYQRGRRLDEALSQLHLASDLCQRWKTAGLLGSIHRYLGEYYMDLGRPIAGRKYLASAIIIKNREQNYKELVHNLYLYGYSRGFQYAKEYVQLLWTADEPGSLEFDKLLKFLSDGKPFWDVDEEKRYVIVPKRRPILEKKKILNAADKIYILLKKKFGKDFADHSLEEIKTFSKSPEFERAINLQEDPVGKKFFTTLREAEDWRDYLEKKYKGKADFITKEFGEYIQFDIEERMVESKEVEEKFRTNLNCVDPIIPYKKGTLMYKQAVETVDSYLKKKPKPAGIYIPYPGPQAALRLLNTLPQKENIQFCSDKQIDISEIAKEITLTKKSHNHVLNKSKETIQNRYKPLVYESSSNFKCPMDHII